jgi:Ca-activated chloride channel family protein
MLTLAYPWMMLIFLLPFVLRTLVPPYREFRTAMRSPWFNRVSDLMGKKPSEGAAIREAATIQTITTIVLWGLIVLTLARPQVLEPPISRVTPTRDLMLLVDLSGSMGTEDFTNQEGETVDRLTAVKEVLDDFLTKREGDRVGLIVFGNAAFVQIPFTQDLNACRLLLNETAVRMAGPRTAFGDAIGLGITLFDRSEIEDRVMIALTDGNDTGSKVPPFEASQIASDKGVTIHVVGVGDPAATGEDKLDEEALNAVAATTGGLYLHADDRDELKAHYAELDQMGTREIEAETYRPRTDLFHYSLGAFLIIGFAYHIGLLIKTRPREHEVSAHG